MNSPSPSSKPFPPLFPPKSKQIYVLSIILLFEISNHRYTNSKQFYKNAEILHCVAFPLTSSSFGLPISQYPDHLLFHYFFPYNIKLQAEMEALKKENVEIQKSIESYLQEIERQKELNAQHQSEIETLLKFNERLLGIIENQLNNKKDSCSLQPISERSERESDLMGPTMNSLMKSKRLVAKSERGPATRNSLVERAHHPKLNLFDKEGQKSQINHSFDNEQLSDFKLQKSEASKVTKVQSKIAQSNEVKRQMSKQISELKKFKNESNKFYDSKINEIRNLSNKLGTYKPIEQFTQISQKLNLSAGAADMIRKAIMKSSQ